MDLSKFNFCYFFILNILCSFNTLFYRAEIRKRSRSFRGFWSWGRSNRNCTNSKPSECFFLGKSYVSLTLCKDMWARVYNGWSNLVSCSLSSALAQLSIKRNIHRSIFPRSLSASKSIAQSLTLTSTSVRLSLIVRSSNSTNTLNPANNTYSAVQ